MPYYRAVPEAAASAPCQVGVLLVNLGTPDAPTYRGVQRYLREFLGDRRVINTTRWLWLPLLYCVILPLRPLRSARKYRKIWMPGGSPLSVYSARLTAAISRLLTSTTGLPEAALAVAALPDAAPAPIQVALGMTYGNPSVADAIGSLAAQKVNKLLVLPLYPQYCSSTTGSVFDRTSAALSRWRWLPELRFVNDYYDDAGYVEALAASIEAHWLRTGGRTHLVFSYHGIPLQYVSEGDPYRDQAEATTRLVAARLNIRAEDWSHCYQSRFGAVVWLQPYTEDTLRALVARGVRNVTVVSPSFAVDCLETLEEVGIDYRGQFLAMGGEELSLVPALNDSAAHAAALVGVIQAHVADWS